MRMHVTVPSRLSDSELLDEVGRLARRGRETTASLIAHLAELYGRRLHERAGFSSLPQNAEALFEAAGGLRKRQVQELLARRFPQPDVASSVRRLPQPDPAPVMIGASTGAAALPAPCLSTAGASDESAVRMPIAAPPRPVVLPLAEDRYRIAFTADAQTREKLELAQDLLRHAIPSGGGVVSETVFSYSTCQW